MILSTLSLQNFRSYTKRSFAFTPGVTLIVGPNTAGKTNILEAITMLALGRSFRAEYDREVVRWGQEIARVKGTPGDMTLELVVTDGSVGGNSAPAKKYTVNGIARRAVDFAGNLRVVLFWPEDLALVTNSPGLRRRYLDSVLIQTDREYRRNLLSYERGLRQRNRLLAAIRDGKANRRELLFWDQLLIRAGSFLTDARAGYIDAINKYSIPEADFSAVYDKSVISEARLALYREEEVAAKVTLVGPHRDDFTVLIRYNGSVSRRTGERALGRFGSRGEQRLGVLWLKLAELSYIETVCGERPLLLLDDIFSELDESHRTLVLELIGRQQAIVTSAEPSIIERLHQGDAATIRL
ncbi:DNA replication and repair protein RecF [Patescibacteria group bacterium]|nr:DNA replication and repair protein RecF [Patescibacteria group bacterium]